MFKFNFNNEETISSSNSVGEESTICWYDSEKLEIPSDITSLVKTIPRNQIIKVDYGDGTTYSCLSAKEVMNMLKEKSGKSLKVNKEQIFVKKYDAVNEDFVDVLKADKEHSDLIPGKYEGGLKTWECTKDLAEYFIENEIKVLNNNLKNKNILDLGCGSGILGIINLFHGGNVTFQDYNKEVLLEMTIPNIFLNLDDSVKNRIQLYSGDWLSFLNIVQNSMFNYDYILTSETIYNPENYTKIIQIIKTLLKPDGIAFVAAKTHYFGVGGSIIEFQNHLKNNNLNNTVCWETNEGVARKILKVTLSDKKFGKN